MQYKPKIVSGPYGAPKKKLHRVVMATLLLALVFTIIFILCARPAVSQQEPYTYRVRKGDTLWDICRNHYGDAVDVRKMIWQVRRLNDIKDPGELQPGMEIWLPGS